MSRQLTIIRLIAINAVVCGLEIAACVAFTFIPPLLLKVKTENATFIHKQPLYLFFYSRLVSQKPTCLLFSVLPLSSHFSQFLCSEKCQILATANLDVEDPSFSPSQSSSFFLLFFSTSVKALGLISAPKAFEC